MKTFFKFYTVVGMGVGIVAGIIVAPLFWGFTAALDWYAKKVAMTP